MKGELVSSGNYIEIDNQMVFPNPASDKAEEVEWKMRHAPSRINNSDLLYAASIIEAYKAIICNKTVKNRSAICAAIKATEQ